jgi:hypothetical protein
VAAKFKMRCRLSDTRLSVLEPASSPPGI